MWPLRYAFRYPPVYRPREAVRSVCHTRFRQSHLLRRPWLTWPYSNKVVVSRCPLSISPSPEESLHLSRNHRYWTSNCCLMIRPSESCSLVAWTYFQCHFQILSAIKILKPLFRYWKRLVSFSWTILLDSSRHPCFSIRVSTLWSMSPSINCSYFWNLIMFAALSHSLFFLLSYKLYYYWYIEL